MCIKNSEKKKKMGGDHRIGGLHVVVLGHTGAVRWLEGKERE